MSKIKKPLIDPKKMTVSEYIQAQALLEFEKSSAEHVFDAIDIELQNLVNKTVQAYIRQNKQQLQRKIIAIIKSDLDKQLKEIAGEIISQLMVEW
jgi:hypothetical protein